MVRYPKSSLHLHALSLISSFAKSSFSASNSLVLEYKRVTFPRMRAPSYHGQRLWFTSIPKTRNTFLIRRLTPAFCIRGSTSLSDHIDFKSAFFNICDGVLSFSYSLINKRLNSSAQKKISHKGSLCSVWISFCKKIDYSFSHLHTNNLPPLRKVPYRVDFLNVFSIGCFLNLFRLFVNIQTRPCLIELVNFNLINLMFSNRYKLLVLRQSLSRYFVC
jgi:hypothetical protein